MAMKLMRRRKIIVGLCILIAALAVFFWVGGLVGPSQNPAVVWRVVRVLPHQSLFAIDSIQDSYLVVIGVSNVTSDELFENWERGKSAYRIDGLWQDFGIVALMGYVGPNESKTFVVDVPQQAQGLRLSISYEQGPMWVRAVEYLKGHNLFVPEKILTPIVNLNRRLPGHFKSFVIEMKLPPDAKSGLTAPPASIRTLDGGGQK